MPNQKPIQINIPNPCAQDWNQMTPAAQGKFCAHCQKCVIDFTGYSDTALYQFFSKNTGHVCGRFLSTQLNRNISLPPQPHSRLYRLFIGFGLTLLFIQVPDVNARPLAPVVIENVFYTPESDTHSDDSIELKILILDEKKEPMIGAIAQLIYEKTVVGAGVADADGNIILKLSDQADLSVAFIKITCLSYKTVIISLNKRNIAKPFIVQMEMDRTLGLIEIKHINYKIPLIDIYGPEKRSISSNDIERMPAR